MRRFLEEKVDVVVQEQQEYSIEDNARMKIRKKLLESALGLGILLNLAEQTPANPPEDPLAPYMDMLRDEEGVRTKMYKDTKGIPTIGVGFNLTRSDASDVFRQCFGDQCNDVFARANDPKRGMSAAEVEKLTRYDLEKTFLPRTQKAVKGFENLPLEARTALVSSAYRGSLLGSPKTLGLINAGKGGEAAAEYLRNREYEKAKKTGSGVAGRMEREAEKFKLIGASPAPTTTAPAPAPAPVAAKQDAAGDYQEYEIKKGDSLSVISKRTGKSVEDLAKQNNISDPNKIQIGQKLRI